MRAFIAVLFLFPAISFGGADSIDPIKDGRYCGPPKRDADGSIHRSASVLAAFQRLHPCPSTGLKTGSCKGWSIDHVIPLSCGGCDSVINLAWMPVAIKSGSGYLPKDRWERKIYCPNRELVPMPAGRLRLSVDSDLDANYEDVHN